MTAVRFWILLSVLVFVDATHVCAKELSGRIKQVVDVRLKNLKIPPTANGRSLFTYNHRWLKTFYQRRSFSPCWVSDGMVRDEASELARALRDATLEGLNPEDYDVDAVETAVQRGARGGEMDDASLAAVDVLLTDAFLHYASDLYSGRIDPRALSEEWDIRPRTMDLALLLQQALDSVGVRESLSGLLPRNQRYQDLTKALARFRALPTMDDPPKITAVRRLVRGDSSSRIITLRKRMSFWVPDVSNGNDVFDESLEQAVMQFQKDNGIEPDGVVGKETIAVLNLTNEQRIQSIQVNLERCRWLPAESEPRSIDVNIPAFELSVMENGARGEKMRVVVGTPDHRTPVFSNAMTYIVLGPCWYVPATIAAKEIVPMMMKDPDYLKKEHIRVFQSEGEKLREVDSGSVVVAGVESGKLRLRMDPGRHNSLGSIKFMFPNQNSVYLHDTPAKRLFRKSMRQFSHGCVRVERPVELAAYLLGKDTSWVREAIHKAFIKGEERVVRLSEPVPVHLQYFTAWVDDGGTMQFRKDIYHWDDGISKALQGAPMLHKNSGVEQFAAGVAKVGRGAAIQ